MNTRALLFAGLLATAVIAFSGVVSENTGFEFTESATAVHSDPPLPEPACITMDPWWQLCQGNVEGFLCYFGVCF